MSLSRTIGYIALFLAIQILSLLLTVPGWFICALACATGTVVPWLWANDDDAVLISTMPRWQRYVYIAWRNPVGNLRLIRGISGPGRPLLYHWWTSTPDNLKSGHYVKFGWEVGAPFYPVMSAGAGRGY